VFLIFLRINIKKIINIKKKKKKKKKIKKKKKKKKGFNPNLTLFIKIIYLLIYLLKI